MSLTRFKKFILDNVCYSEDFSVQDSLPTFRKHEKNLNFKNDGNFDFLRDIKDLRTFMHSGKPYNLVTYH